MRRYWGLKVKNCNYIFASVEQLFFSSSRSTFKPKSPFPRPLPTPPPLSSSILPLLQRLVPHGEFLWLQPRPVHIRWRVYPGLLGPTTRLCRIRTLCCTFSNSHTNIFCLSSYQVFFGPKIQIFIYPPMFTPFHILSTPTPSFGLPVHGAPMRADPPPVLATRVVQE